MQAAGGVKGLKIAGNPRIRLFTMIWPRFACPVQKERISYRIIVTFLLAGAWDRTTVTNCKGESGETPCRPFSCRTSISTGPGTTYDNDDDNDLFESVLFLEAKRIKVTKKQKKNGKINRRKPLGTGYMGQR